MANASAKGGSETHISATKKAATVLASLKKRFPINCSQFRKLTITFTIPQRTNARNTGPAMPPPTVDSSTITATTTSWFSWLFPSSSSTHSSSTSTTYAPTLPPTYVQSFHDDLTLLHRMQYNPLGRTGMRVSALSLGASSLGGMFTAVDDEDEAVDVVIRALKWGINLIDTAPWYQRSEQILGLALRDVPREAYYINTKVGRYPLSTKRSAGDDDRGDEEDRMFDFRGETVIKSVYNSLATLGVPYLDCVHVHDPEFCPDLNIILHETLPALAKLKKEGLIRHIGVAGYPLSVLTRLVQESPVSLDTLLTYCHFTLLDTSLVDSGFLSLLGKKGIGLINASPFAMGLLTHKGPPAWHPATDCQKEACRQVAEYCSAQSHVQGREISLARLALRFTFSEPRIPTTLLSTASLMELTENLRNYHAPLTKAEEKVMQHVRKVYFAPLKEGGKVGWEEVEVNAYWASVGKRHVLKTVYGQPVPVLSNGRGGAATAAVRRKRQRS